MFTSNRNLTQDSEYGIVKAGAPSLARSPIDPDIWYYNGTPAAQVFVALDFVLPKYYDNRTTDLFVGGPNFGGNLGPFLYTLSGTMGGTYSAVTRGIPGIAFSGGNSEQRSYQWINQTTKSGYPDPATVHAQLAVNVVQQLVNNTAPGQPIMPLGSGLNVNTPFITSFTNDSCVDPPFIQTRMTGGAFTDKAVYNATTGLFTYANYLGAGVNVCLEGDCSLPGETTVVGSGCFAAVSVFDIDYDAPTGEAQTNIRSGLSPLVTYQTESRAMYARKADVQNLVERMPVHGGSF